MDQATIQFISILFAVSALLGWLLKQVITHFIYSSSERAGFIEKLVQQNQENTERFTETINHQRTADRELQYQNLKVLQELKIELRQTNKIYGEMLEFLKEKS